jgi:hypothetical protein
LFKSVSPLFYAENMFLGTTPSIISQYLIKQIEEIRPKRIFVPFAGNFVIEQLAGIVDKKIQVFSSDISVYSRAIGSGVTGEETEITVKEDVARDFPVFSGQINPLQKAAAAIFFSEAGVYKKKGEKTKYYRKLYENCIINQQQYYEGIMAKLAKFKEQLGDFYFFGMDGIALLDKVEKGDMVFFDPPFISDSYDIQFEAMNECFDYREPIFTYMTNEVKQRVLIGLHEKGADLFYRPENPLPKDDVLNNILSERYRYRHTYDANYCIYSNVETGAFVGTACLLREEEKSYKLISEADEITEKSKIEILPCQSKIANHFRLMWVKKARMKDNGKSYLLMVDGKLVGVMQLGTGQTFGNEWCLINSDPATPTSRYQRLGKLLLRIICTKEFLNRVNDDLLWEHTGFTTKVYTNEPVSMKYRGVMKLHERNELKPGAANRFELTYRSDKLPVTMKDGLLQWLKQDSKIQLDYSDTKKEA